MVKQDRAFAYIFDGYWQDVGTIEAYYNANMELLRERPGFSLDGTNPVLTGARQELGTCAGRSASIKNSLVSPGCVVKGHVENSILSPQVWVGEGAIIRNSVIMSNTIIGNGSIVDGCIFDEKVSVGDHCHIGPGYGTLSVNRDITVLPRGTDIPAHTVLGCRGELVPYLSFPKVTPETRLPSGSIPVNPFAGAPLIKI
jgi:glucose-1-phosphate adenylyltransferase